ncbi:MAG: alpha/beta hydrolase [Acidimicrobiia bacterium]
MGAIVTEHREVSTGDGLRIAVTIVMPEAVVAPRAVLQCLPGGGCSRSYWALEVEGAPAGTYNFARKAAERGYAVIAADHLGTGESPVPANAADQDENTMAAAMSACLTVLLGEFGLADGAVPVVGVGHSFGAGMTIVQQDRHRDFHALGIFGWSSIRLAVMDAEGVMRAVDERPSTPGSAPKGLRYHNLGPDPDPVILAAARAARTPPSPQGATGAGSAILVPGAVMAMAARVDVPVFLGFSEVDSTLDAAAEPALYGAAPSVTSFLLPNAFHWHSTAPNRHDLWDAFLDWADRVVRAG